MIQWIGAFAVALAAVGGLALMLGLLGAAMDGWPPHRRIGVPRALNTADGVLVYGGAVLLAVAACVGWAYLAN